MHKYDLHEMGKPIEEANEALILIHGRGATAESILPLGRVFANENTYIAAPQATNNTWYPNSFMASEQSNQPWLDSAVEYIQKVIANTAKHIPLNKIYLLGFSQGACLTVDVAARNADHYGGVIVFTGGLIGQHINEDRYKGDFKQTKIYLSNSDNDPHVPLTRSRETQTVLNNLNADVNLDIYTQRPHTITEEEIQKAQKFIFG